MEVQLTPEQEAQLVQIASQADTNPERLAKDVLVRYLEDESRFLAAVEKGIAAPLPYVVLYPVKAEAVEILHIYHGAQIGDKRVSQSAKTALRNHLEILIS